MSSLQRRDMGVMASEITDHSSVFSSTFQSDNHENIKTQHSCLCQGSSPVNYQIHSFHSGEMNCAFLYYPQIPRSNNIIKFDAIWDKDVKEQQYFEYFRTKNFHLTHWGRVTHICVAYLTINASDNGLSPSRRQAIIWTNAGILLIRPLGTNFSEILIEIHIFSFKKMHLKMSSAKRRPFCLGLNVLRVDSHQRASNT